MGEYRETHEGRVWLRPIGGGYEWTTEPGSVRRPTDAELVRARVRAANRDSRTR
ncbi:hypothetical protein [Streptomyces marinisediminis]|uniref:hypothetical protein n=1 Tax=Streptomyces marinisediminis TaxID=2984864 RepID=UPI00224992A8|nr:hypothetical protein [Streptomyces sp. JHD 1]MCX2969265.1 hypothetical protein [Streptomyces sp. JHD 1]